MRRFGISALGESAVSVNGDSCGEQGDDVGFGCRHGALPNLGYIA
jgi:hypothetical protein